MMHRMSTDRRDVHTDILDMMHKMDMMTTGRRDVHADIFRHDAQDYRDAVRLTGMFMPSFWT